MRHRFTPRLLTLALLSACETTTIHHEASTPSASSPTLAQPSALPSSPLSAPATTVDARLLDTPTRRVLRLTNGMTVILQQNRTAPAVAARIYVKAGALTEQQYMGAGISHVLEHLVAGASSGKRNQDANTLALQELGNDSNAYTDEDHTCYYITTTSDKWRTAIDLLVDWTTNTSFTQEQFSREYKVVQRELEMGEAEADRTFGKYTQSTRYIAHPAMHPIIGYKPVFQQLTFHDCQQYFQQMYVPDNMILSVAGDLDLDQAEQFILQQVAHVRRKPVPSIALPPEPNVDTPRTTVAHADIKQARVEWAFPTTDIHSSDMYPMDVLAGILAGGESSILPRKVCDEQGLAASIDATNYTPSYVPGQLSITAVLDPAKIPDAQKSVLRILQDIVANGVTQEAVDRAKARAAAKLVFDNQTAEQQATRNGTDYLSTGSIDFSDLYVQRLQQVTREQVKAVAQKYLRTDRLLATALLPLHAADPFKPATPTTATASSRDSTRKITLANGVTVLITRNPAAPLVTFQLYTLGGLLAETDATNGTGNAMMELMTRGTLSRSHDEIANFLDSTGTSLSSDSASNTFTLQVNCLKAHAADTAALFADLILHPKFDQEQLDQIRPALLADIDTASEDWFNEAYKHTKETFYSRSPYKRLPAGNAEVIKSLTAEQLRKHYEQFFINPRHTVVVIAGDFDPAQAKQWAAAFEAMPLHKVALDTQSSAVQPSTTPVTFHTDKGSATVMFAFGPGLTENDPDRYAVDLLRTYLGGYTSPSGSVLYETLRGEGLVYDASMINYGGEAKGMLLIYALGEPQNAQKIVQHVTDIVAKARAGDIPEAALQAAKDQAVNGKKLSKQTIAERAADEAYDEIYGLGYDDDSHFAERIRAVTKTDVVKAANKYLAAPIVVITTPQAAK